MILNTTKPLMIIAFNLHDENLNNSLISFPQVDLIEYQATEMFKLNIESSPENSTDTDEFILSKLEKKDFKQHKVMFVTNLDELYKLASLLPQSYKYLKKLELVNIDALKEEIFEQFDLNDSHLGQTGLQKKLTLINYFRYLFEFKQRQNESLQPPF